MIPTHPSVRECELLVNDVREFDRLSRALQENAEVTTGAQGVAGVARDFLEELIFLAGTLEGDLFHTDAFNVLLRD